MQVIGVESARHLLGQRFGRDQTVIDRDAGFERVQFRDLDQIRRQIDRRDLRAFGRERLAEQAAAATDIQHPRTAQVMRSRT